MEHSIADHQAGVVADTVGELLQGLQDELTGRGVKAHCAHLRVQMDDDSVVEVRYDPWAPPGEPKLIECTWPA